MTVNRLGFTASHLGGCYLMYLDNCEPSTINWYHYESLAFP